MELKLDVASFNILKGATPEFISLVAQLETIDDDQKRRELIIPYLQKYNLSESINLNELFNNLKNRTRTTVDYWRHAYLIEKCSKPRNINLTCTQRLAMFADTYILESTVNNQKYLNSKFIFLKKSGKHDILIADHGEYAPDFYYFDESRPARPGFETLDRMVYVELKYGPFNTLLEDAEYFKDHYIYKDRYNTKNIVVFKSKQSNITPGFYMLSFSDDYEDCKSYYLDYIPCPQELLDIYTLEVITYAN